MKKTLIAASLSALTLLSVGVAAAQPGASRPEQKAEVSRAELVAKLDARFAKLDTNRDGNITAEERKAVRDARVAERFTRLDADGNGAITLAEMQAAHGKRSHDQHKAHHGKRGHRFGHGHGGMMHDANGDGVISKVEFQAPALERFDRLDADRNGVITAAEHQAAREAMRAQRAKK